MKIVANIWLIKHTIYTLDSHPTRAGRSIPLLVGGNFIYIHVRVDCRMHDAT